MVVGPHVHQSPCELAAVVHEDGFGSAVMPGQSVEHIDDVLALEPMPSMHGQCLSREHVDHGQDAELAAMAELLGHEVHRPGLARRGGQRALSALHDHLALLGQLGAQLQLLLAVDAIALAPPQLPALAAQQHVQPPVAPAHARVGQFPHASSQLWPRVLAAFVVGRASRHLNQLAGPTQTDAVVAPDVVQGLHPQRGPDH
mmetsp:Transcript_23361/g.55487  ORF Transcript_23361/g.55487 Transcript_23361/m.55487 type:complete len:201 (-) Transcript_23361:8033-8635(-)